MDDDYETPEAAERRWHALRFRCAMCNGALRSVPHDARLIDIDVRKAYLQLLRGVRTEMRLIERRLRRRPTPRLKGV